ncbi:MAG: hypothetical protein A2937_02265 [Candidatus Yonathbacteria bacterium RIFCSPLOWO2_01_FULL_47_33b]|uniref:Nudix hydrolase domain-containing protein n=1 Tax=Candidatus Yonathbacteria bacterium RIFCSPLOWO2_01_FULL_47_33b TaxID=1802727 RepID=A0A1G2SD68_9BACT|nr:MAG: hypothetical protein A2937_02265 [Candidatus Yonathbacteria bacterium RIFCSPLOWO2_01_FULL_47_33b]
MQKNLSPEEHYKSLPKKRSGSSVLFLNEKGELLIVKPSYKSGWLPVGGTVDDSESPSVAAQRETREEIGLDLILSDFKIISICYVPEKDARTEAFQFAFFGGVLSNEQISQIKLPSDELEEFRFVPLEEAKTMLSPRLSDKLDLYLEVARDKKVVYLES